MRLRCFVSIYDPLTKQSLLYWKPQLVAEHSSHFTVALIQLISQAKQRYRFFTAYSETYLIRQ